MISREGEKQGIELNEEFEKEIWGDVIMENIEDESRIEEGYFTFIFMDYRVPINTDTVEDIENIVFDKSIAVSSYQDGLCITIPNDVGKFDMLKIPDTDYDTMKKHPFIIKFLSLTKGKIEVIKKEGEQK